MLYIVSISGFVMGANMGYTATSLEEATLNEPVVEEMRVTPEEMSERESQQERVVESLLPFDFDADAVLLEEPDWLERAIQTKVAAITNQFISVAVAVANAAGVFFFRNSWIPQFVPKVMMYAGMASVLAWPVIEMRRFSR
ncbi:hypothetical protein [Halogeometricum limi]|uniref:Uncharacterized protein n=1 Tax=Halogeometricum limi TaxID=555875 RepID=A0A1I6FW73_9EURY|nr:hypothetical protein [Halogeometricum limi]SFR34212.1 hypothetical protein SAMN04488124_0423 [Halogeometricum limi]